MKIAVIDDERPARCELVFQITSLMPNAQIREASSGNEALSIISSETFDLLFIDINLNDMEGTTLAAAARRMMPEAHIVFATAYSQYAVKAFELGVDNYLLKPFEPERLKRVLEKCRSQLSSRDTSPVPLKRLAVNTQRKIVFVDVDQIVYIETSGRSCILHTTGGDLQENTLLGEYEKRLPDSRFYRTHKSYLINLDYISELFPWANNSLAVKMQGYEQHILPVGREKSKLLRQLLGL